MAGIGDGILEHDDIADLGRIAEMCADALGENLIANKNGRFHGAARNNEWRDDEHANQGEDDEGDNKDAEPLEKTLPLGLAIRSIQALGLIRRRRLGSSAVKGLRNVTHR